MPLPINSGCKLLPPTLSRQVNNKLVARLCLLIEYMNARGIYWMLEQPASSLMFKHPVMEQLLQQPGLHKVRLKT